jgi:hypothetical protein
MDIKGMDSLLEELLPPIMKVGLYLLEVLVMILTVECVFSGPISMKRMYDQNCEH